MNTVDPLLRHPSRRVGDDLDAHLAGDGGLGLAAALQDPDRILPTLEAADLRGMGGAGFPTHRKWSFMCPSPRDGGDRYVVANGNEDEPGTFKDHALLRDSPHQVIEGMLIAALALDANHVVLTVNPDAADALASATRAAAAWEGTPLLAAVADHLERPVTIRVAPSSGRYVGGEETALLASLAGGFPFPAAKPPFPAESGLDGRPTTVNNVETFAHVPHILREGAAWYRSLGVNGAAGTKLYSLSGGVLRPGLYELPMGITLRELVFDHGGGMLEGHPFKAVFTGGPSNTLLGPADLDIPLDWDSLRSAGARLGTGAMIVESETASIVARVADYVDFFAENSCGQCPSCRLGTREMSVLLRTIDAGRGVPADLDHLDRLCLMLPGSGRCSLIDGAVTVVTSSLGRFRGEYEQLLVPPTTAQRPPAS
jgi:NADH-quinone oxidoreductase subunit F